jgi:hypothetical protein
VLGKEILVFFWNCWLRNRLRLAAYLVLGSALILLGTLPVTMKSVDGHWVWMHPKTVEAAVAAWNDGVEHTAAVMMFLLLFAAADLGSLGLGESAARKEYHFLITRPRPRQHFVWTAWLTGLAQLGFLALIPLAVALLTLYVLTSGLYPDRLWLLCVGTLILAALVFSMTFAMALATESSRNGFEVVFSLLIVYYVARLLVGSGRGMLFWFFSLQQSPDTYAMGAYDWLLTEQRVHYFVPLLMIAATAVLPFLAQLRFERKDL